MADNEEGYQPNRNEILLSAMLLSASGALHETLVALALAANGGKAGQWLDELESTFVSHAKSMATESVPMELEVEAVEAAIGNIRRVIAWVKNDLESRVGQID